jgi:hypothetical protein
MTVQELITAVYEELGEPSDLYIYNGSGTFDMTQAGSLKILLWLNRAYARILNWKFPNGQQVRFPCQDGETYFQGKVPSGTVVSATNSTVELDTAVLAVASAYTGCVVRIDGGLGAGQVRFIVDYSAARVATLNRNWDTNPDATSTYKVYRRKYSFKAPADPDVSENISLSPVNSVASPRRLSNVTDKTEIPIDSRTQGFDTNLEQYGVPCSYIWLGNAVLFDVAVESTDWFLLEFTKIPASLTLATEEPDIPKSFHEPLVLYTCWIGLRRAQEWAGAYSTKRDIEDLMSTLKTGLEQAFERNEIHVEVEL